MFLNLINFVFIRRSLQILQSLVFTYFIVTELSAESQGYYYVYLSVIAMQFFFEAGIGGVINKHILKIISVEKLRMEKWKYFAISSTVFCFTALISTFILSIVLAYLIKDADSSTRLALIPSIVITGLSFYFVHFRNFFESTGFVIPVQKINILISLISISVLVTCVVNGMALYSILITCLIQISISYYLYKKMFIVYFSEKKFSFFLVDLRSGISFIKSNTNLILRSFGSNLSGYFIYQIFTILTFMIRGPVDAGKIGLTLQMFQTLNLMSSSYLLQNIPKISYVLYNEPYKKLDQLLKKVMWISVLTVLFFGPIMLLILLFLVNNGLLAHDRLLAFPYLVVVVLCSIVLCFMQTYTATVRILLCEPYTYYTILIGLLLTLGNWLILRSDLPVGMIFVLFFIVLIFIQFPFEYLIYKKFTKNRDNIKNAVKS